MLAVGKTQPHILCALTDVSLRACEWGLDEWSLLLDALDAVSPLIDDTRPGLLYLDMHGIPGDAEQWVTKASACLERHGIAAKIGAGANKFTAYAAAQKAHGTICGVGLERAFLAPLSVGLLDIDEDVRNHLHLLGIEKLGDLARLPHGAFVRRFGPQAALWHACARGEDPTPFCPRAHEIAIEASVFGEGRAEEEAQLFFALRLLLARVCADLDRCGKRAGALELSLELEDGGSCKIDIPIASPSADEKTLNDIVRAKLSGKTFPCAVVGLRLRAGQLEEGGEALPIFPDDDVDPRSVAVTLARLEAVIGEKPRRARLHHAHALERSFSYEPFISSMPVSPQGSCTSVHIAHSAPWPERNEGLVPQLRLLSVREISVRLHRGMPVLVDGRRVIECKGPWRIEEGWFSDSAVTRDEYDVLLDDRSLVRIYRQGKYWYLRGAYD
jgi:hypothetical protein